MPTSLSSLLAFLTTDAGARKLLFLTATIIYHQIASYRDRRSTPPGKLLATSNGRIAHLTVKGTGELTIVLDASLGGVEGYLLIDELTKLTRVCIYDRAGYGWSRSSSAPRTSANIVAELHELLTIAEIPPPYILVGDSFGSYNLRLFAHTYPNLVRGLVLTDALHERAMLSLPFGVKLLKTFFTLSFGFVTIGAALGIVRIIGNLGIFELIKPELRKFPHPQLAATKRSFYTASHWLTMAREMWHLDNSGNQLIVAADLGDLPIVSIKAKTFLRPILGIPWLSLTACDRARDRIHLDLQKLSTNFRQISADRSSHFVWIDEPELIIRAVSMLL